MPNPSLNRRPATAGRLTLTLGCTARHFCTSLHSEHAPESQDSGFTFRTRKRGDVEVLLLGRLAATLCVEDASSFLSEVYDSSFPDTQRLMARLTGNYKRGDERLASQHQRDRR